MIKNFIICLFLLLVACSTPAPSPSDSAPATVATGSTTELSTVEGTYVVQPGDILFISVWKEKDLQTEVMVRPDGGLNFPLVGDVSASGKTIEQLRKDLVAKLTKYVPDPVVTVAIKQSAGNKVYVVGKVSRPGEFIATRNIDVMQALSMAGGPTPYASLNRIKILRRVNGELKSIPFKYSRVEKGEDLEQNIVLQGGDVVVVP
jgi:polysaccharide export outer membrane protein